jgi:hypothetical protein
LEEEKEEENEEEKKEKEEVHISRFSVLMRWVYYESGCLLEHLFTENNRKHQLSKQLQMISHNLMLILSYI